MLHTYVHIYIYICVDYICLILTSIDKILTNIGHRFVHQSGLDESSGRNSTSFRHRNAFRVYSVFSKIGGNCQYDKTDKGFVKHISF